MTKNRLTQLLGIDSLMKRNAKNKAFSTMLDIICDFLCITVDVTNGAGVQYPKSVGSGGKSSQKDKSKAPYETNSKIPRPQTSGAQGAGGGARTQTNFFNPQTALSAKP